MKKILVPVDFSGHTDISCRYALEFASVSGAEIRLFHTYFDQIVIADSSFPDTLDMSTIYNEKLMNEIFKRASHKMRELEEKLNHLIIKEKLDNVHVSTALAGGELEDELKGVCTEFRPDLVVMGTTGTGNNLNVWGKVSSFIIDHAMVPVITVPEMKNFHGFRRIMFAADLSDGNAATIAGLIELFSEFSTRIHVVHFHSRHQQGDVYIRMKTLQRKFDLAESNDRISFEVVDIKDDNQSAINRFIATNAIDMIAFQPHRHNLLYMLFTKKITRKNLFATNIPLLSVPAARRL